MAEAVVVAVVGEPGSQSLLVTLAAQMSRLVPLIVFLSVVMGSPALAADHLDEFPEYSGPEFQALYEYAVGNTLPNLEAPDDHYRITGNEELDARIWEAALDRGYELRPTAGDSLVSVAGVPMQPQAAEAWTGLREEARRAGMRFIVSSAYRSPAAQRTQFLSMLDGTSDDAIDEALTWWSIPGTSKHHAGYALDFRYERGTFAEFRSTPDYGWLADDNFAEPKRHGLIPSYPDDVANQGPNPEPWEFVWIGTGLIHCGLPQAPGLSVGGPEGAVVDDIARCPGGPDEADLPDWLG